METINWICKKEQWEKAVDFHGHVCGGLALGVRAAVEAQRRLGIERAEDEEIVCVTENDACCVDGIQAILGCTVGKGNLIYRGTGKLAFSFFDRRRNISFRLAAKDKKEGLHGEEYIDYVMSAPLEEIFTEGKPRAGMPEPARHMASVKCQICGEAAPESRIRVMDGKLVCLDCRGPVHRERGWDRL